MNVQTPQHEQSRTRQTPAQEDQETQSSAEGEGEKQLRHCIQKFLKTYVREESSDMSDLADVLIGAGWDRKSVAACVWGDIKGDYYSGTGSGWKPSMFVKLQSICKEWEA
ncbi:hypothetical protein FB446DRAFT_723887 [Lentinula raphanica]|nr:hypothetical protein FB446DRAFT_723887 [Lentinula raphanica]